MSLTKDQVKELDTLRSVEVLGYLDDKGRARIAELTKGKPVAELLTISQIADINERETKFEDWLNTNGVGKKDEPIAKKVKLSEEQAKEIKTLFDSLKKNLGNETALTKIKEKFNFLHFNKIKVLCGFESPIEKWRKEHPEMAAKALKNAQAGVKKKAAAKKKA